MHVPSSFSSAAAGSGGAGAAAGGLGSDFSRPLNSNFHIQQILPLCAPTCAGFEAPANMSVTVKDVEAAYMPLQDLTFEVTYEPMLTSTFYAKATAVVWLLASVQLLATCMLSYPRLPSTVGAAMCCAGGVAAVCGVLASLIQLSCNRQMNSDNGE